MPTPWIVIHGTGLWKPAAKGAWERVDGGKYDGFYENAGPDIDPEGRGVCLFSIQGSTIDSTCAITRDGGRRGARWRPMPRRSDMTWGRWTGRGGMSMLAKKHHNGDLALSRDGAGLGRCWPRDKRRSWPWG